MSSRISKVEAAGTGGVLRGRDAVGKIGVAVSVTGALARGRFTGTRFGDTLSVLLPQREEDLAAIVAIPFY